MLLADNVIFTPPNNLYSVRFKDRFQNSTFSRNSKMLFSFSNLSYTVKAVPRLPQTLGQTLLCKSVVCRTAFENCLLWVILMNVQMCHMLHFQHVNHWWVKMRYSYPLTAWPQLSQWLPVTTAPRNLHRRFHVQSYCRKTETPMAAKKQNKTDIKLATVLYPVFFYLCSGAVILY